MSIHSLCFEQKFEKYQNFYLKFSIFGGNFSVYLNRRVFMYLCIKSSIGTKGVVG